MSAENAEQAPNFELPRVPAEGVPTEEKRRGGIEQGDASLEAAPRAPAAVQPPMPSPLGPTAQPPVVSPTADTGHLAAGSGPTAGLAANDADLIEKEWVDKSKQIIAANREDPYKQKNEMSRAKVDYVQKRFNKTLKVDDAAA